MPGIFFNVNGKDVNEDNVDPELTLAYYVRNKLGLRGTKLGCEEGVCGSCTVVLGIWDDGENKAVYRAVNACLVPLFHVHRTFVITVEGVGSREKIHPIQDRMARGHALQCGFCSPGFVMSAYALLRNHPDPSIDQINAAIRANLCRCTGYRPILEALYSFSPESGGCCGGNKNGGGCCKDKSSSDEDEGYDEKLLSFNDFPKYDPTQEIIFPPSLRTYADSEDQAILNGNRVELTLPKNLTQFKQSREGKNVISSGLITRFLTSRNPKEFAQKWITTRYVKEFNEVRVEADSVKIGSAVTIQKFADTLSSNLPEEVGCEIAKFIQNFSSPQIANFATWSGAIVSAAKSSISVSDVLILLNVLDAKLSVLTESGELTEVEMEKFVEQKLFETGTIVYAKFSNANNGKLFCLKLGETSEQDSTNFNFAVLVGNKPSRVFVGLGGQPRRLTGLETFIDSEKSYGLEDFYKASNLERNHHSSTALTRFASFLKNETIDEQQGKVNYLQYFKPTTNEFAGRPIANYFNERSITGEALYVNDIPAHNAVHLGFVLSTFPNAEVLNVDFSEALKLEGVAGYFGVSDVPGNNTPGLQIANMNFPDDTTIFADKKVEAVGQVIGVIAANDVSLARRAAKLVKVEYKELKSLVDFKEARDAESYLGDVQHYGKDEKSVNESFEKSSKTKRLGGGFGGKVNNASWIACMCAVVARKLNRPVYGFLSRSDDLAITGKRHGVYAKYKVGIDSDGKIEGIHYEAWLNGGWSKDHSEGVTMVMGILVDGVYKMGNLRFDGYPVKTNSNSNTALRGYGNPQSTLVNEGVMRRIAREVNKDVEEVKKLNFALQGDHRFMGGKIHNDALGECWEYCTNWSEFEKRKRKIAEFNRTSEIVKRGIAMSSVRFGLPHPGPAGHGIASLLINLDGSVQLSIGGTEMGQGLNQKMLQVCSEALKRPIESITIVDTSTDKITNAPETGGSQNADTNGLAVLACCEKILSRLQPIIDKNEGEWEKSIREAYASYVPLQCTEYGVVERTKFGVHETESPYNTTGACAVEIEVDTLTGYNRVICVDMVMDVGESLNPAIDIGQIEGAFMQGYGLVTCEKITFNKTTGQLEQNTAGKYKIPRASDVPKDFRVKLLGINKANGAQVYSSKGIGEPPLMMSCGAVHSAIIIQRRLSGKERCARDASMSRRTASNVLVILFLCSKCFGSQRYDMPRKIDLFHDVISQSTTTPAPKCQCLPPSTPTSPPNCIPYDSRLQAASLEEAIVAFPDLTITRQEKSQQTTATLNNCKTKQCRDCYKDIRGQLRKVGLLPGTIDQVFSNQRNFTTCQKYRFARQDKGVYEKNKKTKQHYDWDYEEYDDDSDEDYFWGEFLGGKKQKLRNRIRRDVEATTAISQPPNSTALNSTGIIGYASCQTGTQQLNVLRNESGKLVPVSVSAGINCECRISVGSSLESLVLGKGTSSALPPVGTTSTKPPPVSSTSHP
ncbi:Protein CBG19218 [Caenorhabditis briggsae]|uniref:Protein CBG19218 n=1 Tax=Caenorhabditis briggsae TaxID=6238 RepID=A8XV38_CAEBR|nr:Protein CBG19218 [Caenorhabditis briggsae]CAP36505.1 Protein CBG19218 [Caenorhabditis briggsae]